MTIDEAALEFGTFSELNDRENSMILIARTKGFAHFWPAFPSAYVQATNTLVGAKMWLRNAPENCKDCEVGSAHNHELERLGGTQ